MREIAKMMTMVRCVALTTLLLELVSSVAAGEAALDYSTIRGFSYTSSNARNSLEMWSTKWNETLIANELKFAAMVGFNLVRVKIHNEYFQKYTFERLEKFMHLAHSANIPHVLPVLFDGCGSSSAEGTSAKRNVQSESDCADVNYEPSLILKEPKKYGECHPPSPGFGVLMDRTQWGELEKYVTKLGKHFDTVAMDRPMMWDVIDEPECSGPTVTNWSFVSKFHGILKKSTSLPVTVSMGSLQIWEEGLQDLSISKFNGEMLEDIGRIFVNSDVLSFHSYHGTVNAGRAILELAKALLRNRQVDEKLLKNKKLFLVDICADRSTSCEQTLRLCHEYGIACTVSNLFKPETGLLLSDGSIRDPIAILAMRGLFSSRQIAKLPSKDREVAKSILERCTKNRKKGVETSLKEGLVCLELMVNFIESAGQSVPQLRSKLSKLLKKYTHFHTIVDPKAGATARAGKAVNTHSHSNTNHNSRVDVAVPNGDQNILVPRNPKELVKGKLSRKLRRKLRRKTLEEKRKNGSLAAPPGNAEEIKANAEKRAISEQVDSVGLEALPKNSDTLSGNFNVNSFEKVNSKSVNEAKSDGKLGSPLEDSQHHFISSLTHEEELQLEEEERKLGEKERRLEAEQKSPEQSEDRRQLSPERTEEENEKGMKLDGEKVDEKRALLAEERRKLQGRRRKLEKKKLDEMQAYVDMKAHAKPGEEVVMDFGQLLRYQSTGIMPLDPSQPIKVSEIMFPGQRLIQPVRKSGEEHLLLKAPMEDVATRLTRNNRLVSTGGENFGALVDGNGENLHFVDKDDPTKQVDPAKVDSKDVDVIIESIPERSPIVGFDMTDLTKEEWLKASNPFKEDLVAEANMFGEVNSESGKGNASKEGSNFGSNSGSDDDNEDAGDSDSEDANTVDDEIVNLKYDHNVDASIEKMSADNHIENTNEEEAKKDAEAVDALIDQSAQALEGVMNYSGK